MTAHLPKRRRGFVSSGRALTSSAAILKKVRSSSSAFGTTGAKAWQRRAFDAFNEVGEIHFPTTYASRATGRVHFDVQRLDDEPLGDTGLDAVAREIMDSVGGSEAARAQLIRRLAANLFLAGEAYLAGLNWPEPSSPFTWFALSPTEVSSGGATGKGLSLELDGETHEFDFDDVLLVRVWNQHPEKADEPDSPVRAALDIVDELRLLGQHVTATARSKMAGNGLLIMPNTVDYDSPESEDGFDGDPFLTALAEAMVEPINDRSHPNSVVPLLVRVPDEAVGKVQYLRLDSPLDEHAAQLRSEAITRIAIALDLPAEILTGLGGANAWSAWFVGAEAISLTIAPLAETIADSLSIGLLRPTLLAAGATEEQAAAYAVTFDTAPLRPTINESAEAQSLFDRGVIDAVALRKAHGYEEESAPEEDTTEALVLEMVTANPTLLVSPGVDALLEAVNRLRSGEAPPAELDDTAEVSENPIVDGQVPDTADEVGEPPVPAAG